MNTQELLNQAGIETSLTSLPEITGLSLRADTVQKGDIFIALKGQQQDGADFIPTAVQNGASLILCEREVPCTIPLIVVPDLRQKLSLLATKIYPSENIIKLAVTGTNGKTSTVFYVQQLLNKVGVPSASLGTIGVDSALTHIDGTMTTPDAITLNKTLHSLQNQGIRVVALEASSHGLEQGRLKGLTFSAGAFTNLTQDHLDYHKTMANYLDAKSKLFADYLEENAPAVLNADDPCFETLKEIAVSKKARVISYGINGTDIKLLKQTPTPDGQDITFSVFGKEYQTHLNIVGDFQVFNLFAALGLCIGANANIEDLIKKLPELNAPAGRIEHMGTLPNGASVFVDYAHTPDAVERVLKSLRAHTKGQLVCLLGCGGNRDTTKRPLMGKAASELADKVYITDDNPRFEDPTLIRQAILEACPKGIETDNRESAIHTAVSNLNKNDVLVLAGKGHEAGQTIQGITYAMDDRVEAKLAIKGQTETPVWTKDDLELALSARVASHIKVFGISIDTRTLKLGDMFIALKGERTDGHNHVKQAVQKGASVCLVDHIVPEVPSNKQIVVQNTMTALESLAKFARMRSSAVFFGITGSSGKTTTKEMLKACLSAQGKTHATTGNFNNQIGVPLTLAGISPDTKYAVIEMGMNHSGELMHLSNMVRPDLTIITSIGSAHREFFPTERDVAVAKSEIFDYQNRQGTAVLNHDSVHFDFLKNAAKGQDIQHILSFGQDPHSDFRLSDIQSDDRGMFITFTANETEYRFHLNFFGSHFALDALGVLALIKSAGADIEKAVKILETLTPTAGRGASLSVPVDGKQITLIDDAYNANPSSMTASIKALGLRSGRKIAVIGDMLELGTDGPKMHADLITPILSAKIDKVYLVGPLMKNLWDVLPFELKGMHVQNPTDLISLLKRDLQTGDNVLIKASHGTGLDVIIKELKGNK